MGLITNILWGRVLTNIATYGKKPVPLSKVVLGAYAFTVLEENHREQLEATRRLEDAIRESGRTPEQRALDREVMIRRYEQHETLLVEKRRELENAKEEIRWILDWKGQGFWVRTTLRLELVFFWVILDEELRSILRTAIMERKNERPVGDEWFEPKAQIALFNAILTDPTPIVEAMKLHYDPALPNSLVVTDAMISASSRVIEKLHRAAKVGKTKGIDTAGFEKSAEKLAKSWARVSAHRKLDFDNP